MVRPVLPPGAVSEGQPPRRQVWKAGMKSIFRWCACLWCLCLFNAPCRSRRCWNGMGRSLAVGMRTRHLLPCCLRYAVHGSMLVVGSPRTVADPREGVAGSGKVCTSALWAVCAGVSCSVCGGGGSGQGGCGLGRWEGANGAGVVSRPNRQRMATKLTRSSKAMNRAWLSPGMEQAESRMHVPGGGVEWGWQSWRWHRRSAKARPVWAWEGDRRCC